MAEQITNYKCPACSGPLHFAAKSGMMECEYCGSNYSVQEIEDRYAEADSAAAQAKKEADNKPASDNEWAVTEEHWNGEGMKSYGCPSCGATLVCDDNFAASSCPYCGNPTIVPGQFTDMLKPDFVLPFKLEKDDAIEALKKHYGKRYLLPQAFKNANHLEEVKGVYVPFWLYDGTADGDCTYEAVHEEKTVQGQEEIITKKYYHVERKGKFEFKKIPADASTKMDDKLMDSIEPYNYEDLKPFSKAYLTGYMADKYDVSVEENAKRAIDRAKESTKSALYQDVISNKEYTYASPKKEVVNVKQGKVYYAMMPVWLLTTRCNGQGYTFAMNGQSGKMVGDLPVDKPKLWITVLAVLAVIAGIGIGVCNWAPMGAVIAGLIGALITYMILNSGMKNVKAARAADVYVDDSMTKITNRVDRFVREEQERRKLENNQK